jgi:hypothetical protein
MRMKPNDWNRTSVMTSRKATPGDARNAISNRVYVVLKTLGPGDFAVELITPHQNKAVESYQRDETSRTIFRCEIGSVAEVRPVTELLVPVD